MELQDYIEAHVTPESELLEEITRETYLHELNPHMVSGHVQGRLLSMLSKMIRPKHILELGTFTGYSALCLAEGLSDDGRLITIEHNDELETTILRHFEKSEYRDRLTLLIGDALEVIQSEAFKTEAQEPFDMVFIDADKRQYTEYYEAVLPLIRKGGYILADNTLWDSHIIDPQYEKDHQTAGLRRFNDHVIQDHRVEVAIIPIRDGITVIRKIISPLCGRSHAQKHQRRVTD